jgi:hypothetical protein
VLARFGYIAYAACLSEASPYLGGILCRGVASATQFQTKVPMFILISPPLSGPGGMLVKVRRCAGVAAEPVGIAQPGHGEPRRFDTTTS